MPVTNGVNFCSLYIYILRDFTPIVNGLKSYGMYINADSSVKRRTVSRLCYHILRRYLITAGFSKWLNLKGTWDFYLLLVCLNLRKTLPFFQWIKTRHSKTKFLKHPLSATRSPTLVKFTMIAADLPRVNTEVKHWAEYGKVTPSDIVCRLLIRPLSRLHKFALNSKNLPS